MTFAELRKYLPWLTEQEYTAAVAVQDPYAHPVSALRRILIETRVYDDLARTWIQRAQPDLAIVYFQGTDSIGHMFAPFAPPKQPTIDQADYDRYSGVPRTLLRRGRSTARELSRAGRAAGGDADARLRSRVRVVAKAGRASSRATPRRRRRSGIAIRAFTRCGERASRRGDATRRPAGACARSVRRCSRWQDCRPSRAKTRRRCRARLPSVRHAGGLRDALSSDCARDVVLVHAHR